MGFQLLFNSGEALLTHWGVWASQHRATWQWEVLEGLGTGVCGRQQSRLLQLSIEASQAPAALPHLPLLISAQGTLDPILRLSK